MRIKVITKEHGEYNSDLIKDATYEDAISLIEKVAKGQASHLAFPFKGGRMFFTEELLKTSVFVVMKD